MAATKLDVEFRQPHRQEFAQGGRVLGVQFGRGFRCQFLRRILLAQYFFSPVGVLEPWPKVGTLRRCVWGKMPQLDMGEWGPRRFFRCKTARPTQK